MEFYILFFLANVFSILIFKESKVKMNVSIFLMLILSISVGIRYKIGADFDIYYNFYKNIKNIKSFGEVLLLREEIGFSYIAYFFNFLGFREPYMFFGTISVLTFYFLIKLIKKMNIERYSLEILLIYFSFFFLNFQYNTIRHGLMVSIVWYAFSFIPQRKIKLFILYILLGSLFHSLAIIFLPFYWLLRIKQNKKTLLFLILVFLLTINEIYFFSNLLPKLLEFIPFKQIRYTLEYYLYYYYDKKESKVGISIGVMVYFLYYIILFFNKKKLENILEFKMLFNAFYFALFFYFILNDLGIFVQRISSLFYLSLLFLIVLTMNNIFKNKKTLMIFYFFLIAYGVVIFNANVSRKDERGIFQFKPYKTFLNK